MLPVLTADGTLAVEATTSGDTEDSKQPWCFVVRKVTFDSKGAEGESGNGSMVFARTCEELALDWMKEGK